MRRIVPLLIAAALVSAEAPAPSTYELVPESLLHQLERCEANWMADRQQVSAANAELAKERDAALARVKELEAKAAPKPDAPTPH